MSVPIEVVELVERFDRNREDYRSANYKETQLRREFIDPLFAALGWDMDNALGYAEAYKDVIHEDAIKVSGSTKAPDYCFRIGGTRKFFLEAKRPSIDIRGDAGPAYQLRRYAWSAKLSLSILTNFEKFAAYDSRRRPRMSDKPSVGRTLYITCDQYVDRWDEIASIFSKQAVLQGSFDKYAVSTGKRGTATVDAEFLKDIELWRETLARNIALRNASLSVRDLNLAVQRTIDRIIFLRMCEDRGVEDYRNLQALLNGPNTYRRLVEIFRRADDRYNSGLFHFRDEPGHTQPPDTLTPGLSIDDKVLKSIFKALYYPESPYEFSVLPADILGNVYEQFLGKVIHLTKGHRARVEDKPEVKKAGGVYYTPGYIVDYIVKQTIGKLIEGKTPRTISRMRFCDPACGSGSFLIGTYRKLLDYHRDWYVKGEPAKHRKQIYQGAGGQWYLTTAEKQRILLNNIHGVDIDPQAIEVTKLNLLLCVLEDENRATIRQLALFHRRALPDLGDNIKCGNSLIGSDFYSGKQLDLFDDDAQYKINAFDWEDEFPEVFKGRKPGFDAIIGNPPYVRVRLLRQSHAEQVDYLERNYECATHVWDVYLLFYERSLQLLNRGGCTGFIVPIQTLHQPNCRSLRKMLVQNTSIAAVTDCSRVRVFTGAVVKNCIIVAHKGRISKNEIQVSEVREVDDFLSGAVHGWPQAEVASNPGFSLKTKLLSPLKTLCRALAERSYHLGDLFYVTFGLRSCAKNKGGGGKDRLITASRRAAHAKPYMEGRDISRYSMAPPSHFIRFLPDEMYSPRSPKLFERRKIVSQTMLSKMRLVATIDDGKHYVEQSLLCVIPHGILTPKRDTPQFPLEFALALMNSKLAAFYFATWIIDYSLGGGLVHATPGSQEKLLIPRVEVSDTRGICRLVKTILSLHKKLAAAKTEHAKTVVERRIKATDREIDGLVYEMYGLTADEVRIIEDASTAS